MSMTDFEAKLLSVLCKTWLTLQPRWRSTCSSRLRYNTCISSNWASLQAVWSATRNPHRLTLWCSSQWVQASLSVAYLSLPSSPDSSHLMSVSTFESTRMRPHIILTTILLVFYIIIGAKLKKLSHHNAFSQHRVAIYEGLPPLCELLLKFTLSASVAVVFPQANTCAWVVRWEVDHTRLLFIISVHSLW